MVLAIHQIGSLPSPGGYVRPVGQQASGNSRLCPPPTTGTLKLLHSKHFTHWSIASARIFLEHNKLMMVVADCLYHSESWSWVLSHLFWLCADCCSVHYFGIFFICCLASLEATVSGNLSVRNFNMTLSAVQLPPAISARWFDDVACLLLAIHSFTEGLLYSTKDSWYRAPAGTSTGCHIPLSAGCFSPSSLMMLYFAWLLNQPASGISAGCFECLIWRYFAIPPLILSASYYLLAIQLINSFFSKLKAQLS